MEKRVQRALRYSEMSAKGTIIIFGETSAKGTLSGRRMLARAYAE